MAESKQPLNRELLSAYVDNELSTSEREDVERWMEQDETIRAEVEMLREVGHSIRDLPKFSLGDDFTRRVLQQATDSQASAPTSASDLLASDDSASNDDSPAVHAPANDDRRWRKFATIGSGVLAASVAVVLAVWQPAYDLTARSPVGAVQNAEPAEDTFEADGDSRSASGAVANSATTGGIAGGGMGEAMSNPSRSLNQLPRRAVVELQAVPPTPPTVVVEGEFSRDEIDKIVTHLVSQRTARRVERLAVDSRSLELRVAEALRWDDGNSSDGTRSLAYSDSAASGYAVAEADSQPADGFVCLVVEGSMDELASSLEGIEFTLVAVDQDAVPQAADAMSLDDAFVDDRALDAMEEPTDVAETESAPESAADGSDGLEATEADATEERLAEEPDRGRNASVPPRARRSQAAEPGLATAAPRADQIEAYAQVDFQLRRIAPVEREAVQAAAPLAVTEAGSEDPPVDDEASRVTEPDADAVTDADADAEETPGADSISLTPSRPPTDRQPTARAPAAVPATARSSAVPPTERRATDSPTAESPPENSRPEASVPEDVPSTATPPPSAPALHAAAEEEVEEEPEAQSASDDEAEPAAADDAAELNWQLPGPAVEAAPVENESPPNAAARTLGRQAPKPARRFVIMLRVAK